MNFKWVNNRLRFSAGHDNDFNAYVFFRAARPGESGWGYAVQWKSGHLNHLPQYDSCEEAKRWAEDELFHLLREQIETLQSAVERIQLLRELPAAEQELKRLRKEIQTEPEAVRRVTLVAEALALGRKYDIDSREIEGD